MLPLSSLASVAVDVFASLLAPPRCAACEADVPRLHAFCAACARTVERAPPDGEGFAAFTYGGAVAQAITRFKYARRPDLARPLGDLLWRALEPHALELARVRVVPVPLHPARLAERGYNQSALLAGVLAKRLGVPFVPLGLRRLRATEQQASLDRGARARNVASAFQPATGHTFEGAVVLLVDDVRTTGSTLRACGRALLGAGATEVLTAVLAQAE